MKNLTKVLSLTSVFAASAFAAPVTVDLSDATSSLTNAGTAMIGLAVLVLGFILVLRFLRR